MGSNAPAQSNTDFNRKRDGKFEDKRSHFNDRNRTLNMNGSQQSFNRFNSKANLPGGTMTDEGMIIDYKVNYDQFVDSMTIFYADWSYL